MELFRLVGNILIDDKDALGALKRTEDRTKATQASFKKFGESAVKAGKTIAIGLGVAATAATALVNKFASTADQIDKASQRVGMSAEEYQKWTYAAKLSGIEADKLEAAMKRQQTAFSDAVGGSKNLQKAYKKLGIDITKVGDSSEAFELVMEAMAEMEDTTLRNEVANDLFGKSYADLIPLLNEGAEGMQNLRDEAVELGGVISNENVKAGAKFGDTMERINTIFTGIAMELATALLPYFQQLADWVVDHKEEIANFAKTAMETLATVLSKVGDFLGDIVGDKDDASAAFEKIVWFFGAITAAPIVGALAAHPVFALVTAIGALIAFKDQFTNFYRAMTPGQQTIAKFAALALAVGSVLVAATLGTGAIGIAAGMAALSIALGAVIAEGDKIKSSGSSWRPESPAEVTANAWQYGSNSINPSAYTYPGSTAGAQGGSTSEDIAVAVKNELKNVTIQLDGKAVGKFVDKRLLTATE